MEERLLLVLKEYNEIVVRCKDDESRKRMRNALSVFVQKWKNLLTWWILRAWFTATISTVLQYWDFMHVVFWFFSGSFLVSQRLQKNYI